MKKFLIYLSVGLNLFFIVGAGAVTYWQLTNPVMQEMGPVISVRWYSVDKEVDSIEKSMSGPVSPGQRKLLKQIIAGRHVGVVLPEEIIAKIYKKDPYYKYSQ